MKEKNWNELQGKLKKIVSFQDKKDIPWWLGISYKGIGVYDKNDKNVPRKVSKNYKGDE